MRSTCYGLIRRYLLCTNWQWRETDSRWKEKQLWWKIEKKIIEKIHKKILLKTNLKAIKISSHRHRQCSKPFQISKHFRILLPFAFRLSIRRNIVMQLYYNNIQIQTQFKPGLLIIELLRLRIKLCSSNGILFERFMGHGSSFIELKWILNLNSNTKLHRQYCKSGFWRIEHCTSHWHYYYWHNTTLTLDPFPCDALNQNRNSTQ